MLDRRRAGDTRLARRVVRQEILGGWSISMARRSGWPMAAGALRFSAWLSASRFTVSWARAARPMEHAPMCGQAEPSGAVPLSACASAMELDAAAGLSESCSAQCDDARWSALMAAECLAEDCSRCCCTQHTMAAWATGATLRESAIQMSRTDLIIYSFTLNHS